MARSFAAGIGRLVSANRRDFDTFMRSQALRFSDRIVETLESGVAAPAGELAWQSAVWKQAQERYGICLATRAGARAFSEELFSAGATACARHIAEMIDEALESGVSPAAVLSLIASSVNQGPQTPAPAALAAAA